MSYIWTVLLIHFRNRNEQKWKPRMKTIDLWLWRPLRACVQSPPLFLRQVWLRPALSSCRRVCICALLGRLWSVDTAGRVTPLHALHINTNTQKSCVVCQLVQARWWDFKSLVLDTLLLHDFLLLFFFFLFYKSEKMMQIISHSDTDHKKRLQTERDGIFPGPLLCCPDWTSLVSVFQQLEPFDFLTLGEWCRDLSTLIRVLLYQCVLRLLQMIPSNSFTGPDNGSLQLQQLHMVV